MKINVLEELFDKSEYSYHVFGYRKNKKPNQFRITRSFFYTHGKDEKVVEREISKILTDANIKFTVLDSGEHWHSFVGGAKPGSSQDSYWYVIVEIQDN